MGRAFKMKYIFSTLLLSFPFLELGVKLASSLPSNELFGTKSSQNDESNVEIYFDGYSHPNCAAAKYLGDIIEYESSQKTYWVFVDTWVENIKKKASEKYGADIICGVKIEYILNKLDKETLSFQGTAMKKQLLL